MVESLLDTISYSFKKKVKYKVEVYIYTIYNILQKVKKRSIKDIYQISLNNTNNKEKNGEPSEEMTFELHLDI